MLSDMNLRWEPHACELSVFPSLAVDFMANLNSGTPLEVWDGKLCQVHPLASVVEVLCPDASLDRGS